MRYIANGSVWTDEEIQFFVNRQIEMHAERGLCRWKLLEKASGEMIGFCGVGLWHGTDEIGWWLAHRYWGRGLATEAAQAALRDAFERVQLERIISIAQSANTASIRIMEKLGFRLECKFKSNNLDLVRYAIDHQQYFASKITA